jgi:hypothetical protein
MAMLGCRLIGLDEPTSHDQIKKLIVYVEMDRCAGDAVAHVTGAKLGRRSLKFVDYGIMAATFLNLETEKAYRVISTEEARDLAAHYAPEVVCRIACSSGCKKWRSRSANLIYLAPQGAKYPAIAAARWFATIARWLLMVLLFATLAPMVVTTKMLMKSHGRT